MSSLLPKPDGKKLRLGMMGGTFDPIHMGHLVAAEEAWQQFNLDQVIFMPSGDPPHKDKRDLTAAEHRFLMTMLAVIANPFFTISRLEIDSEKTSYTIDTVRQFYDIYGDVLDFFLITGADAILEITTWKDYRALLESCSIIAASRPGYSLEKLQEVLGSVLSVAATRIYLLEVPALSISSTDIRQRVAAGKTIRYLTPEPVEQYVYKNKLYQHHSLD